MNNKKIILVIGATGNQGGAVINALLGTDFAVRAFTRNAQGKTALDLAEKGVEVAEGDIDDPGSLKAAMMGVYGVFSVQNFMAVGVEREISQGICVADMAKEMGVEHFVFSSVGGADRNSSVPHFDSKWQVEEHIRGINLPQTILRPTFFMENFDPKMRVAVLSLVRSCLRGKPLQMIAVADIGKWAAHVFMNPKDYIGQGIEICGDELNFAEIQQVFRTVTGKKVTSFPIPSFLVFLLMKEMGTMFKWLRDFGYQADLKQNRAIIPTTTSFQDWIVKTLP